MIDKQMLLGKKRLLLLSVLLVAGLPGCWVFRKKNDKGYDKTKKYTEMDHESEMAASDTLSDDDAPFRSFASDESTKHFYDDTNDTFEEFAFDDDNAVDFDDNIFVDADFDDEIDTDDLYAHLQDESLGERQGFKTVYFGFDKDSIDEDQKEALCYNVERCKELIKEAEQEGKDYTLIVEGHACHSAGEADYNTRKSEKRAQQCAEELKKLGIEPDHIRILGRSYDIPAIINGRVVTGDRNEQWANRRVELSLVYS